jgi:hypothetical protein
MRKKFLIVLLVILGFFSLAGRGLNDVDGPPGYTRPEGSAAPSSAPASGGGGVTTIIHTILFPFSTISEALINVLVRGAEKQIGLNQPLLDGAVAEIGSLLQAPQEGQYARVAGESLPLAAALAVPLFMLRLALYQWNRLTGEGDTALTVIADWLLAGLLAAGAGWLMDLSVRTGWWITGRTLGETRALALSFMRLGVAFDWLGEIKASLFAPLIAIGLLVGSFLALAALAFGFAVAQASLFILAVLGPPLNVVAVLHEMRWLRSLWLKAFTIVSLTPVVAGGIFKAAAAGGLFFTGHGFLTGFIRVIWLWGAAGAMISLAGVVGRLTIGAAGEALQKSLGAVRSVADKVVMVVSGVGAPGAAAAGASLPAPVASGATPAAPPPGAASGAAAAPVAAAVNHYQAAGTMDLFGLRGSAQQFRSQAHQEELSARRQQYAQNLIRFTGAGEGEGRRAAFNRAASGGLLPPEEVEGYYQRMRGQAAASRINLDALREHDPELAGQMTFDFALRTGPDQSGEDIFRRLADERGYWPLLDAFRMREP